MLLKLSLIQSYRNNNRNLFHYVIGFTVIFISIFIILLLLSLANYTTLIFLQLAESYSGQFDLLLSPNNNAFISPFFNYSLINYSLLPPHSFLHSPRFNTNLGIINTNSCTNWSSSLPYYAYLGSNSSHRCQQSTPNCLLQLCSNLPSPVNFYLLDTLRDRRAGIGKEWPFDPIPFGESIIQQDIADTLDLSVGDYVFVTIPWADLSPYFIDMATNNTRLALRSSSYSPPLFATESVTIPVKIYAIIPYSLGKLNQATQNLMFMEYESILQLASQHLHPWFQQPFQQELQKLSIYDQVPMVLCTYQTPRYLTYFTSDFQTMVVKLLTWASDIRYRLGFTMTSASLPVLKYLQDTQQVSAFINLIMTFIIVILCGLAGFLIYSLLLVSVETRTYELAVFRMVGMNRLTVLLLISVQALSYSIPALVSCLSIGQGVFVYLAHVLSQFLGVDISPYLPLSAILIVSVIGLLVPILASILPIQKALRMNLHDALDKNRNTIKTTVVTVHRSNKSFEPLVVLIGVILAVFGFGIYYFLPLALLNNWLDLLFNIFLVILLGFVLGLVLLGSNFLHMFQTLCIQLIFTLLFMENRALVTLVRRNLVAHNIRNRKTAMMYGLSLAFIIFLSITVNIEVASLQYDWKRSIGADFKIYSYFVDQNNSPISITSMAKLETYAAQSPYVAGFAYKTWPLGSITRNAQGTDISNMGRLDIVNQMVYGVSPGFYDIMGSTYLSVDQYDPQVLPFSPSESLYTPKGQFSAILGAYYQPQFSLYRYTDPFLLHTKFVNGSVQSRKLWKMYPLFFARSSPAVFHTSLAGRQQDMLVSIPTFLNMTGFGSVFELPYQTVYIKLQMSVSDREYALVKRELRALLDMEDMMDIRQALKGSTQAANSLGIVFDGVTALVMLITFFSLNTSFYVNIIEQAKEIGILRALGLLKLAVVRLYFYESMVLVLSSVGLGCIIGTIMGWTMAAQRTVLTEIPLSMQFPARQVLIIGALSVVSAFFSTVFPVYMIVYKRALVQVLKD